ncbi:hypothetical protein L2D08_04375 [Domibacillus sp. PGB-M46]|uniref:hypothetical protein n=1 Tax=Domibacillus sp. PGB-M46 TaxID=2910255 RepID=UPI001F5A6E9A|nr:hypothetical protein [Domibacillus sp. PGB-M46]MCI2253594.1 hypothetical protein [Domibacillus sp. PGB-M46]
MKMNYKYLEIPTMNETTELIIPTIEELKKRELIDLLASLVRKYVTEEERY